MRIAVLILAYNYPAGVAALSQYFHTQPSAQCFVHVDVKAEITPFIENCDERTIFIEERVNIYWRGFAMVQATVNLLKAAKGHYDRVILLSDDSSPLVGLATLCERLSDTADWLATAPRNEPGARYRYDKFFMLDAPPTQVRWVPMAARHFDEASLSKMERLANLYKKGKKPLATYYHGSQWMVLTPESVQMILDSWENDIWLRESFEFSEVPDEAYFHSVLGSQKTLEWRPSMYTDWNTKNPPRVFRSIEELAEVRNLHLGELFIRKVDFATIEAKLWLEKLMTS